MTLMPVADALAAILNGVSPLESETVPLAGALGRVLAQPLAARRTQPPFAASAMDGYAVIGADAAIIPARLTVIGAVPAGKPFDGRVSGGEAVRIFTGAPVPDGADTVVIQENTERDGDTVTLTESTKTGANIRSAGTDFCEGDELLQAGMKLLPRHLSLAASMNWAQVPVRRKPRVAYLATGDELVPPGETLGPGQIVSSNGVGLSAFVTLCGGEPVDLGIARDEPEALAAAVARAREEKADIFVTLGGASVGEHDLVLDTLKKEGMALAFWRIAMRPGKPLMSGMLDGIRVLGLPGNPVSALVCARLFLQPLIGAMLGMNEPAHATENAVLAGDLRANDTRQDYIRARLEIENGTLTATPFARQDSSQMSAFAASGCLIVRPPHAPAAGSGDEVQVLRLDSI